MRDNEAVPVPSLLTRGFHLILGVWWIGIFSSFDGTDELSASETVFILGAEAFSAGSAMYDGRWVLIPIIVARIAACIGLRLLNWPPHIFMEGAASN